jgi:murein DD-endopeptidase MepM/ murein hydrolase activator NlpD
MRHTIQILLRGGRPFILQLLVIGAMIAGTLFVNEAVRPGSSSVDAKADVPQFRLPFAEPPGPDTWFVSQGYGTTVWAQRNWPDLYAAGQGIHFGVDFATRCGRNVLAIGDGTVLGIDGPYGSAPHNLAIQHANGYISIYGHLRERTTLVRVGQQVKAGDVVAHSGDPYSPTCDRAPHLHLEIRINGVSGTTNPMNLIPADWDRLTLGVGAGGTNFAQDLTNPRQWATLRDQPDIHFGGGIIVNYPTWEPYA